MIGFLIDMDGVIYRGGVLIEGADEFINQLIVKNIPFRFMTNNSQRTRLDVVAKLGKLGIYVEEQHIFTCAMATARYLASQDAKATAFVIGEGGLLTALRQTASLKNFTRRLKGILRFGLSGGLRNPFLR